MLYFTTNAKKKSRPRTRSFLRKGHATGAALIKGLYIQSVPIGNHNLLQTCRNKLLQTVRIHSIPKLRCCNNLYQDCINLIACYKLQQLSLCMYNNLNNIYTYMMIYILYIYKFVHYLLHSFTSISIVFGLF